MTLKTDYSKTFSYARMQNGIPAVRSITLRNPGPDPLTDLHLSIRFDPAFSDGYETVVSDLPPKGKPSWTASRSCPPPPSWPISRSR